MFVECPDFDLPFSCPYPFVDGDQGFINYPLAGLFGGVAGVYTSGFGWQATNPAIIADPPHTQCNVQIFKVLAAPVKVGVISMEYNLHKGVFDNPTGWATYIQGYNGATLVASQVIDSAADPDGDNKFLTVDCGDALCDTFYLGITCANTNGIEDPGDATITEFVINGFGSPPC
jgi:hypothetical protein